MYKSPIEVIYGQLETQLEGEVMQAVQRLHVNVDKEELLRALKHDRGQYEKGYRDAMDNKKWIPVTERLPENEKVIVVLGYPCEVWTFNGDYWEDEYGWLQEFKDVTHWMPLPEPPKGD